MAAVTVTKVHEMSTELSKAHTNLLSIQFGYVNSMALSCAIQLGIPDLIHSNDSSSLSLSELAAAIPIPAAKTPHLYRLMRLLVHLGIFALDESSGTTEPKYILTPASKLLTTNHDMGVVPYSKMLLDPALVNPLFYLGDWIKMEGSLPFELCHGGNMWVVAAQKPDLNKDFNAAMASDSQLLMSFIVTHSPQLFYGLKSLIDVGGGTGGCARTIAKAFPDLNVKVLDLPHVAADFPNDDGVQFIVGDMFKHIPSTDAVLLKVNIYANLVYPDENFRSLNSDLKKKSVNLCSIFFTIGTTRSAWRYSRIARKRCQSKKREER